MGELRLKETADIPARIAELRSVLLETRSDDLREAIRAAIEDCQQQLAALEQRDLMADARH